MNIVGIDPGGTGGIAIYRPHQNMCTGANESGHNGVTPYKLESMTEQDVFNLLSSVKPAWTFLEKVHSSPQQKSVSAFSFGYAFGIVHMAAIAAGHKLHLVTPQKWQSVLQMKKIGGGFGQNDTAKKKRNREKAQELYPGLKIINATADALLICEYGRRFQSAIR